MARVFSGEVKNFPSAHTPFVTSLDFMFENSYEVVIAGNSHLKKHMKWLR